MNWEDKIGGMLFDYEEDTISQEEIIDAIKSLLKKQREICAETYFGADLHKKGITYGEIMEIIKNAPGPEGMPDKVKEWDFTKPEPE